jgi:ribonuclease HI
MADIFLLSSSEDIARVQPIRDAFLAQGRSVYWRNVPGEIGSRDIVEEFLDAGDGLELLVAEVVVVVWTHESVRSGVVGLLEPVPFRKIFLIVLDDVAPSDFPKVVDRFARVTKLLGWTGDTQDPAWRKLNEAIDLRLRQSPASDLLPLPKVPRVSRERARALPEDDLQESRIQESRVLRSQDLPALARRHEGARRYPPDTDAAPVPEHYHDKVEQRTIRVAEPPVRKSDAKKRPVDASAFCPSSFKAGESELVQVLVHLRGQRREALRTARAADEATRFAGIEKFLGELEPGDRVSVSVDVKGARIEDPPEEQTWTGEILTFGFRVISDGQARHVAICAVLSVNGAHVGRIAFKRRVKWRYSFGDLLAAVFPPRLSRFKRVFFSYARVDREQVKKTASEYEKFGISFFQDILHLDPGERWKPRLWKEIDRCDIFVLFWSSAAKASEWVLKEAERAWRRQARNGGLRPILRPEILEHPPPIPDQDWLREFHFNDPQDCTARGHHGDILAEPRPEPHPAATPQRVIVHIGGACYGNPGPGGWGVILQWGDDQKELRGGEPNTTSNRMELTAAIIALEALNRPCTVELHTDSEYLREGITTADRKPVKNVDLWQHLEAAMSLHKVHWHWVRGLAGHDLNEGADELARSAITEIRAQARVR